jgi:predicted nucleic acid-binding protein
MIVVDNNILSTFARVGQFELLFKLFPKDTLGIPPVVYDEMMAAIRLGCSFLEVANEAVQNARLLIVPLTSAEIAAKQALPTSFGAGDVECVILCQTRADILLTNDRRVRNFCRTEGIAVFDLPQLLRALWENGILSQRRVRRLVDEMETAENMVITNKQAIFQRATRKYR